MAKREKEWAAWLIWPRTASCHPLCITTHTTGANETSRPDTVTHTDTQITKHNSNKLREHFDTRSEINQGSRQKMPPKVPQYLKYKYKKGHCLYLNSQCIIAVVIIMFLVKLYGSFSFLIQPWRKTDHGHNPGQDDNVKILQAQIVKEWLGGSMKNHFLKWIGTSESRP